MTTSRGRQPTTQQIQYNNNYLPARSLEDMDRQEEDILEEQEEEEEEEEEEREEEEEEREEEKEGEGEDKDGVGGDGDGDGDGEEDDVDVGGRGQLPSPLPSPPPSPTTAAATGQQQQQQTPAAVSGDGEGDGEGGGGGGVPSWASVLKTLGPDHPLLRRFQDAKKRHLEEEKSQLQLRLRQLVNLDKVKSERGRNREALTAAEEGLRQARQEERVLLTTLNAAHKHGRLLRLEGDVCKQRERLYVAREESQQIAERHEQLLALVEQLEARSVLKHKEDELVEKERGAASWALKSWEGRAAVQTHTASQETLNALVTRLHNDVTRLEGELKRSHKQVNTNQSNTDQLNKQLAKIIQLTGGSEAPPGEREERRLRLLLRDKDDEKRVVEEEALTIQRTLLEAKATHDSLTHITTRLQQEVGVLRGREARVEGGVERERGCLKEVGRQRERLQGAVATLDARLHQEKQHRDATSREADTAQTKIMARLQELKEARDAIRKDTGHQGELHAMKTEITRMQARWRSLEARQKELSGRLEQSVGVEGALKTRTQAMVTRLRQDPNAAQATRVMHQDILRRKLTKGRKRLRELEEASSGAQEERSRVEGEARRQELLYAHNVRLLQEAATHLEEKLVNKQEEQLRLQECRARLRHLTALREGRYKPLAAAGEEAQQGMKSVGKTSLVTRYEAKSFHRNTSSTIGASFSNFELIYGDTRVKMQVWDTAGQERFRSMAPMYYRGANAALIVFDITNYSTFSDVKSWVHELRSRIGDDLMLIVVGNKKDLTEDRVVNTATAEEYATSIDAPYIETSALDNTGVQEVFSTVAEEMVKQAQSKPHSNLRVYAPDGKSLWSPNPNDGNIQLQEESEAAKRRGCC
ncbi:hypothetical protein Pmani_015856 [Petrolisthes manimaculis]|uniref:Uncharacterized protein n=1 Tax=Petrolisthes manimaculis TaxID=1843537 RepID=A0AAE1PQ75_9EUCA|nr:hypothetical protein Pmani_015856 [Petrolisthes manimaculis]